MHLRVYNSFFIFLLTSIFNFTSTIIIFKYKLCSEKAYNIHYYLKKNSIRKGDFIISYRISIKSLKGDILTYRYVESYSNEDGLLTFTNPTDGTIKRFSISNAEISEEVERNA